MNKRTVCFYCLLILLNVGCKEKNESDQSFENNNSFVTDQIEIELNNDTVQQNNYVKGIIRLTELKFPDKNSKIVVVLENNTDILKSDLSNERESELAVFQNLELDSINRQYFKGSDPVKTAAFGKLMKNTGSQKIRGYVMEYYGIELGLNYDITSDSLSNQRNKIYFEKEITVVPN